MNIIGARALAAGEMGLIVDVGGTSYMLTGKPSAIQTLAGPVSHYAAVLANRQATDLDHVLGDATLGVGRGGGEEFVTGPYAAIDAMRDIVLRKAA